MTNEDDDLFKESTDFITECLQGILDVADHYIQDPEVKEKLFKEINDDFNEQLGGWIRK